MKTLITSNGKRKTLNSICMLCAFVFITSCGKKPDQQEPVASTTMVKYLELEKRANSGNVDALRSLIAISFNEFGDKRLLKKWTLEAARLGDMDAQGSLFEILIEENTEYSVIRAGFWLNKAKGNANSKLSNARMSVYNENSKLKDIENRIKINNHTSFPSGMKTITFDQVIRTTSEIKALKGDPDLAYSLSEYSFKQGNPVLGLYWLGIASENGRREADEVMKIIAKIN